MTDTTSFDSHLRRMAATPHDGHDAEWVLFLKETLKMPICYVSAAQAVISQGGWCRAGHSPIGYVKTATYRVALRMGLAEDRYIRDEPWVPTKDCPRKAKAEDLSEALLFDHRDRRPGCAPLRIPKGKIYQDVIEFRIQNAYNDQGVFGCSDYMRRIPRWLLKQGVDGNVVDWQRVAFHSVQKPRMIPAVTSALMLRFQLCIGLPAAMDGASTLAEEKGIAAAWKWVDRNHASRIRPLFQMAEAPKTEATSYEPAPPRCPAFLPPSEALRRVLSRI